MRMLQIFITTLIAISVTISCSSQSDNKNQETVVSESEKVEVVYFHFTRRCATCNAIEDITREAINEMSESKVAFADYNLDEEKGSEKAEKLGIFGQALLIVGGNKKINLTNQAFMNARSKPDELKSIIKEKIASML